MQNCQFRAMGCEMLALLDTDSAAGIAALAAAPDWFATWEQALSRFRADSELAQLNQHAGTPFIVSQVLWDALDAALDAAEQSADLVTPTLLAEIEAAGYDRSFEQLEPQVTRSSYLLQRSANWRMIRLDETQRAVHMPQGIRLDLGGTAKGWSADLAAQQLAAYGPALVDAGGDIAVSGPQHTGEPWAIGIADPFTPTEDRAVVLIERGGVATSGRDYRRWQRDGHWQHHIIDPRTGQPALTDVLSATVIGPSAWAAEVGAKVALVLGSQAGIAWLEQRADLAGMLILEDGQSVSSCRMQGFLARKQSV